MIKKALLGKEVSVKVVNDIGTLSKVTSFLVNHGINLEGIAGYSTDFGEEAALMFITDNNAAAVDILMDHGYTGIQENEVIIVELENTPGSLKNISEIIAQNGINITYIYATTCAKGCPTKIVFSTSDNHTAINLLKE